MRRYLLLPRDCFVYSTANCRFVGSRRNFSGGTQTVDVRCLLRLKHSFVEIVCLLFVCEFMTLMCEGDEAVCVDIVANEPCRS